MKKLIVGLVVGLCVFLISICYAVKLPSVPEDRIIYINGNIVMQTGIEVSQQIERLDKTKGDIRIVLTTPGGNNAAGFMIMDAIDNCKNDVQTVAKGFAMSMGTYILAHGTKGKRSIYKNTETLIHETRALMMGLYTFDELKECAMGVKKSQKLLRIVFHRDTGLSLKFIRILEKKEEIMDAETTIKLNIVDGYYEGEE